MDSTIHQLLQQQLRLLELFSEKFSASTSAPSETKIFTSTEAVARSITKFHYDPANKQTFCTWFAQFEHLFRVEFEEEAGDWKVKLLLQKLGPSERDRYTKYILPKLTCDNDFNETVETLRQIFGDQTSLFNMRFNCLNITKSDSVDFATYAGIVNKECERFKITPITDAQFKCLIFICGLRSPCDADIRTRILSKIEQNPDMTLHQVAAESQRLVNLKHDSTLTQQSVPSTTAAVNTVERRRSTTPPALTNKNKKPPSRCWNCGHWHFVRFCPFKFHRCRKCKRKGHREGFCTRSWRKPKHNTKQPHEDIQGMKKHTNRSGQQNKPSPSPAIQENRNEGESLHRHKEKRNRITVRHLQVDPKRARYD